MKKMVCLILAVCCVAGALIGCGSGEAGLTDLTEEDFMPYQNGEPVKELMEEKLSNTGTMYYYRCDLTPENDKGYETSRGIKLGSTYREVIEAYRDINEAHYIGDGQEITIDYQELTKLIEPIEKEEDMVNSVGYSFVIEQGKYYNVGNEEYNKQYYERYPTIFERGDIPRADLVFFFDENGKVDSIALGYDVPKEN